MRSYGPDRLGSTSVHAYAPLGTTFRQTGVSFGTAPRRDPIRSSDGGIVHAYSGQKSTLRHSGASTFGREPKTSTCMDSNGCAVHTYYSGLTSTLRKNGATAFGLDKKRDDLALCPVHSYAALPAKPLHRAAPATFGRANARPPPARCTPCLLYTSPSPRD